MNSTMSDAMNSAMRAADRDGLDAEAVAADPEDLPREDAVVDARGAADPPQRAAETHRGARASSSRVELPWTKLSRDITSFLAETIDDPTRACVTDVGPAAITTEATAACDIPEPFDPRVGSDIGPYEVLSRLGRGGMGVVYRCRHRLVHSHVAIKLLHDDATDATIFERFVREARAANAIESAHVLPILDFGRTKEGRPYAVMEALVGESLEARADRGRLPFGEVVEICRQTAIGMAAAHRAGILHRDLKPANLFLERRPGGAPFVRILDFGVCKQVRGDDAARLTTTGFCVGTPQFCSPEQATAGAVGDATDIYSLGAVAYELFSGRPTFEGSSIDLLVRKNLEDPVPIAELCPGLSPAAIALVTAMLDRCPARRPASMEEVAARFAALVEEGPPRDGSFPAGDPHAPRIPTTPPATRVASSSHAATDPDAARAIAPTPTTMSHAVNVVRAASPPPPRGPASRKRATAATIATLACVAVLAFVGQGLASSRAGASSAGGPGVALGIAGLGVAERGVAERGVATCAAATSIAIADLAIHESAPAPTTSTPRPMTEAPSRALAPARVPLSTSRPPRATVATPTPRAASPSPLVDPFQ